jgi:hypothetical protein
MGAGSVSGFQHILEYDIKDVKSWRNQRGPAADGGQGNEVFDR